MSIPPSGVTLTTLLGDPALRLGRAAVDDADLGLAVTAAAVSELTEPGPWLEGGELLLTVGFLLPADVEGLTGYCRHLREHGVAALGIGLGADLPHRRTPDALVTAARRAGLPLLAVPDGVPFVAVTRAVFAHRDAAERSRLQWALRTQRALTAAAVVPGGPAAVLTAHAGATGRPAVVVDLLGRVLAAAPPDGAEALAAELAGTVATVRRQGLLGAAVETAGGRRREVHPLGSHRIRALLLVDGPARGRHSNQVTGDLVSLLSLDLERRAGLDAAARRERARLLATLERGVVDDAVAGHGLAAADLAAVLPDALVRVVRDAPGAPAGRVELAAPASAPLDTVLATLAAGRPAGVGIVVRPGALAVSLRQARSALPVARMSGRPVHAADVASARMLLALLDHERLGGFADAVLGPFDADPRGAELLRAVAAFVEHNGHWEATATALGVHRHTVRNRITAAEQVSGRRLSAAQDRHELWLALQARDLGRVGTDGVSPGGSGADRL